MDYLAMVNIKQAIHAQFVAHAVDVVFDLLVARHAMEKEQLMKLHNKIIWKIGIM